jgi:hypothetical protein
MNCSGALARGSTVARTASGLSAAILHTARGGRQVDVGDDEPVGRRAGDVQQDRIGMDTGGPDEGHGGEKPGVMARQAWRGAPVEGSAWRVRTRAAGRGSWPGTGAPGAVTRFPAGPSWATECRIRLHLEREWGRRQTGLAVTRRKPAPRRVGAGALRKTPPRTGASVVGTTVNDGPTAADDASAEWGGITMGGRTMRPAATAGVVALDTAPGGASCQR